VVSTSSSSVYEISIPSSFAGSTAKSTFLSAFLFEQISGGEKIEESALRVEKTAEIWIQREIPSKVKKEFKISCQKVMLRF